MTLANDPKRVRQQYTTDKNLNARSVLHQRFSINRKGWARWVFEQYHLFSFSKVLELGCGNGGIWKANQQYIPTNMHLVMTDLSEGMLNAAKENLSGINQIEYTIMDIQNVKYPDNTFDVAISNHMLYHVPDRKEAIKEVARVLKSEGIFYATTNGINNMKELKEILKDFDSSIDYADISVAREFGLENGEKQLLDYFEDVQLIRYEDALHITEAQPLVDYVLSFEGHSNVTDIIKGERIEEFKAYISNIINQTGNLIISKDSGIFVSRSPKC